MTSANEVSEINASARIPLLYLIIASASWLLLSSAFELISTLKFHNPNILANCAWFTYGRAFPVARNAFVYGFAAEAGLAVMLWLIVTLGRVKLQLAPIIFVGTVIWNLGVTLGLGGILYGENTGFEFFEMPRYAAVMLFIGYVAIGLGAFTTLHQRHHRPLLISQWFTITALFWFAWIFSTACLLLTFTPLRGALQSALDFWYVHNLINIWLGFMGLSALFYFIPAISRRLLHNDQMAVLAFWTLVIFGSWGGIPVGTPLPTWMSALSTVSAMLAIVPVLAVSINIFSTIHQSPKGSEDKSSYAFLLFGTIAYVIYGVLSGFASVGHVTKVIGFTWFIPAQQQLALYGFFAMTIFGSIYYLLPRLMGIAFPSPKLVGLHFVLAALGIVLYVLPLAIGGIEQGKALNMGTGDFASIMTASLKFLRVSTLGDTFMLMGHLVFLVNIVGIVTQVGRKSAQAFWVVNTSAVEVKS